MKELQEKKSLSESQLQRCESRKQEIIDELEKRKDLMRNQDQYRRKIEDNSNYRKTKAEVDELLREIEILEENMLKVGVFSAIETELRKLSEERERLCSEVFLYCKFRILCLQSVNSPANNHDWWTFYHLYVL